MINSITHQFVPIVSKEKVFPRVLAQPTSSSVYICDLLIKGFAVTGCPGCMRWHYHTTLKIILTPIALGSEADIFAREDEIAALNIFASDFSLIIPHVIYSQRV